MKLRLELICLMCPLVFALLFALTGFSQSNGGSDSSTDARNTASRRNDKNTPGKEIGRGGEDIGKGVAKGSADLGKGVAGGVGDLATGHGVGAATSVGKGTAGFGKNVGVGTGKGAGKIGKGVGGEFKKLGKKSKKDGRTSD
jgi:hypothetical protein